MKENPKIVFILGPTCSGKTSLAKLCASGSKTRIRLSADQIRGSLKDYDKDYENHQRIRNHFFEVNLDMFLQNGGFDIFCEVPRSMIEVLGGIIDRAQNNYSFTVYLVFLDTNDSVLSERFTRRKKDAAEKQYTLAVSDEGQFKKDVIASRDLIQQLLVVENIRILPRVDIDTSNKYPEETLAKLRQLVSI